MNTIEQLTAYMAQTADTVTAAAAPLLTRLSTLTGVSEQILLWIIALMLVIDLVFLWIILRRKAARKKATAKPRVPAPQTATDTPEPATQAEEPAPAPPKADAPASVMGTLRNGLAKTRKALSAKVDKLFLGGSGLDDAMLEDLEEMLITSDVGVETSMKLIENLSCRSSFIQTADDLKTAMREEIFSMLNVGQVEAGIPPSGPHVMMVVGVNGVGKTTTIGKLAARFVGQGKSVLIVAADTFRAAASEQLAIWAERSGAAIVRHKDNSDPAAVAFDGMEAALARHVDIVIIDTAGRLHTKVNLMEELKKIKRTVAAKLPGAPHETLMVLDGTTGQNALQQAKLFNETIGISGIALTKLDGTAKGGIAVGISHTLGVPLKYVGVGEQIGDLQDFEPRSFADAMI
jgi:fused signal recognition particle receptor